MTGALVLPHQRAVLDVANLLGVHMGHLENVGQLVEFLLLHFSFVDNDGVVQVSTLDKVSLEQWNDITNKHKGTRRRYLLGKVVGTVKCGKLAVDEFGLKRTHGGDAELLVGKDSDA